jgi:hypothetical protein
MYSHVSTLEDVSATMSIINLFLRVYPGMEEVNS